MRNVVFLFLIMAAGGCSSSGGGGGTASAVNGTDFTGTYVMNNVQCYNTALTTLTNSTTYASSFSDTVVVSGNSFTETAVAGACTVAYAGNILINSSGMTLSGISVTSATGGSCTATKTLNGTAITPTSVSTVYSTGQTIAGVTNAVYVWNAGTKAFGILSAYTDGSGGYCFIVYTKQ